LKFSLSIAPIVYRGFLNDGSPCMEPECRVYRARVDAADVEIEENN
jgi:hypothetical protein